MTERSPREKRVSLGRSSWAPILSLLGGNTIVFINLSKEILLYRDNNIGMLISLSNKAYARLKGLKKQDESFSEAVLRATPKKKPALEFFGVF